MSLLDRIEMRDNETKLIVRPKDDGSEHRLQYRYIKITDPVSNIVGFSDGDYNTIFSMKKGEVLELREEEEIVYKTVENYQPSFKVYVRTKKDTAELSFSTNQGLNLSRIIIEDPQKRVYPLGVNGKLDEHDIWYLPVDAAFSKNRENASWHIVLDQYSNCVYDYTIE